MNNLSLAAALLWRPLCWATFSACTLLCWEAALAQPEDDLLPQNEILNAYVLQNQTVKQLRTTLAEKSKAQVDVIGNFLNLEDEQKDQLLHASKGDIARFMKEMDEIDLHTRHLKMEDIGNDREQWQRIWPIVMPARTQLEEGLHGTGSLFEKRMHALLTPQQMEAYKAYQQAKLDRLLMATTKLTLSEFEKTVPLTRLQREKIVALVESAAKPKKFQEQMAIYVGVSMLSKLPKDQLSQILNKEQMQMYLRYFRNAERFGGMEW